MSHVSLDETDERHDNNNTPNNNTPGLSVDTLVCSGHVTTAHVGKPTKRMVITMANNEIDVLET